jgi:predicted SAM-dependent methyltransferase
MKTVVWQVRGRMRLLKIKRRPQEVWLELGAGYKAGQGNWVTIDMNGQCDLYYNLANGIPFPDNSIGRIYSSHVFEHLTCEEAKHCLRECVRVLKEGGEFSIAVPNARIFVDAYLTNEIEKRTFEVNTPIDHLNYVAYCGGVHKNMFDTDSLCYFLRSNGLSNVTAREFDSELDIASREWQSIYAKGIKITCVDR